jgi:peroxiredoxin Q/BCP
MGVLEGQKAPAFNLAGSDGRQHALKDYAGRALVLYFYPKDDTPGCTKEACGFRDQYAAIQKTGAAVLGVSRDGVESHGAFIAKYQLPFVLLSDPEAKVMTAYGAYGKKMMYGKEVEGVIRSTVLIGPDGRVIKHWAKVPKAETHPEAVLTALT